MKINPQESGFEVVERLQLQAKKLEQLEQQITQLQQERSKLKSSNCELNEKLNKYLEEKRDWEWFFENSLDMLCVAGMDGYFKRVNPAFSKTLGYSRDELLSRPFTDFVHPDDVERTANELQSLGDGDDSINFENRYKDAEGNWRWLSWCCPALTPQTSKLFAIARDITTKKENEAKLLYKAQHDPLTDLYNRAAFDFELEQALARIERNPELHLAILLLDLDGFKPINDQYGHQAGDQVLIEIAGRFKSMQRKNDLVCRLGGDEFIWMIEGSEPVDAAQLAVRLEQAIKQPIHLADQTIKVGCSIGIAHYPEQAQNAHQLLQLADSAMYQEKARNKQASE